MMRQCDVWSIYIAQASRFNLWLRSTKALEALYRSDDKIKHKIRQFIYLYVVGTSDTISFNWFKVDRDDNRKHKIPYSEGVLFPIITVSSVFIQNVSYFYSDSMIDYIVSS